MNIRKERTHQCGLTNLDFRTKGDTENMERYQANLKFTDMGTMGKTQFKRMGPDANEIEHLRMTSGRATMPKPNPRTETGLEFYKTKNKRLKQPVQIGKKKEQELEEEKWTDKIFTGDNPKLTAFLSGEARDRDSYYNTDVKKRRTLSQEQDGHGGRKKADIHADVDQETQLVPLKNKDTLEGKIDLNKVRDIRRALRRRYATRTNFQKIFS